MSGRRSSRPNRVVNTSLLVPPTFEFTLPVSCVEQGRWHETAATFDAGEAAYPALRRQKVEQVSASLAAVGAVVADQAAVWDEIAGRQRRGGTRSSTGAMRDVYAQRAQALEQAQRALPCPDDGAVGVVALIGGRASCADVFDRPETLCAYWRRLIRSYALDAAEAADGAPGAGTYGPPRGSAARLLRRPLGAERAAFPSPGLGIDVRVRGNGVVGAALVHAGAVVHTALFRTRTPADAAPGGLAVQRPSRRARWLSASDPQRSYHERYYHGCE